MWPKTLLELLPHLARLIPMADKFLTTRTASEKAQEAALAALTDHVRTELGAAAESQSSLLRQMQAQNETITSLALDVSRARIGVEGMESRVAQLESSMIAVEARTATAMKLLGVAVALMVVVAVLLVVLLLRTAH